MMLNMMMFLFIQSCYMYSFYYKHILLNLISLEFMMMNMIYMIYYSMMINEINLYLITIFLSVAVCESVLGLSLLINLVRLSGNDYMMSMKLMKW